MPSDPSTESWATVAVVLLNPTHPQLALRNAYKVIAFPSQMKIANVKSYTVCERSEFVELSDEDIEELRQWKAHPYKGKSAAALAAYVANLEELFTSGEELEDAPMIADRLASELWTDIVRTKMWDSDSSDSDSKITVFDDDENELGSSGSNMV